MEKVVERLNNKDTLVASRLIGYVEETEGSGLTQKVEKELSKPRVREKLDRYKVSEGYLIPIDRETERYIRIQYTGREVIGYTYYGREHVYRYCKFLGDQVQTYRKGVVKETSLFNGVKKIYIY